MNELDTLAPVVGRAIHAALRRAHRAAGQALPMALCAQWSGHDPETNRTWGACAKAIQSAPEGSDRAEAGYAAIVSRFGSRTRFATLPPVIQDCWREGVRRFLAAPDQGRRPTAASLHDINLQAGGPDECPVAVPGPRGRRGSGPPLP